jgi:hypothetical protein
VKQREAIGDAQDFGHVVADWLFRSIGLPIQDGLEDGPVLLDQRIDRGDRRQAEKSDAIELCLFALNDPECSVMTEPYD